MTYLCGPSTLSLTGHPEPILPGSTFEHDFGVDGPEGEHGPDREAAMIASGAISVSLPAVDPASSVKTDVKE